MDKAITRKDKKIKRIGILLLVLSVLICIFYLSFSHKRTLNVNRDEVTIKPLSKGYFEDFITFRAKIEPLRSMLINNIEGGAVQEIYVENGAEVKKGQPLLKLYNPNKELSYMERETSMIEQINNLRKSRLDLRNQELGLAKDLTNIEHDYLEAENQYDLNKGLFDNDIISKNEWIKTRENFRYQKKRKDIIQQRVKEEKKANQVQLTQIDRSLNIMEKSLMILRKNKENFLITAPVSGRLSSFDPIRGKNYNAGESLGKIDMLSGYKLMAKVDEFYLARLSPGQKGTIGYKNKSIGVTVSKVLPEVVKGRFLVELTLDNPKTDGLKQGLSFGVRLTLSKKTKTLLLPKGSFYQKTGGKWIFVVKGNRAFRKPISLGRENPSYYEVLSGLQPHDKVITSSYDDYKNIEIINLKNKA